MLKWKIRTPKHHHELVERDRLYVNLDAAVHGTGSEFCGPGVLPEHRLMAEPTVFSIGFGTDHGSSAA